MNISKKLKYFLIISLILIPLYFLYMSKDNNSSPLSNDKNMEASDIDTNIDEDLNEIYRDYNEQDIQTALDENKKVLLFFYATWCPTCKGAEKDIFKNYKNLPENLVVFKVDYDKETELKQKYNVVAQHTFVQLDSNLEQITIWNGGGVSAISDNIE